MDVAPWYYKLIWMDGYLQVVWRAPFRCYQTGVHWIKLDNGQWKCIHTRYINESIELRPFLDRQTRGKVEGRWVQIEDWPNISSILRQFVFVGRRWADFRICTQQKKNWSPQIITSNPWIRYCPKRWIAWKNVSSTMQILNILPILPVNEIYSFSYSVILSQLSHITDWKDLKNKEKQSNLPV